MDLYLYRVSRKYRFIPTCYTGRMGPLPRQIISSIHGSVFTQFSDLYFLQDLCDKWLFFILSYFNFYSLWLFTGF
jgi:hypothetical protein